MESCQVQERLILCRTNCHFPSLLNYNSKQVLTWIFKLNLDVCFTLQCGCAETLRECVVIQI